MSCRWRAPAGSDGDERRGVGPGLRGQALAPFSLTWDLKCLGILIVHMPRLLQETTGV